jgi:disulfide bond formation protein DsbB
MGSSIVYLMALATAALDAGILVFLVALMFRSSRARARTLVDRYGLLALFLFSAASLAGTLVLQYVVNLQPCALCWWQRICMYPIPLISLIAILKNQKLSVIADSILAFSAFGFLVALYQHLLQMLPAGSLIPCDAANECAVRTVFEFGFVTLPWMAVSAFALLFLVALMGRRNK